MRFINHNSAGLLFKTALTISFISWGCYYDSVEELYPISSKACDTANVSYVSFVEPYLRTNCYGCHGTGINSGGITLEGIDNLKTYANSGQLTGSLNHQPGFSAMPPSAPKADDCTIKKISAWVSKGTPAN